MNINLSFMSGKFERCEILAMVVSAGPPFVISRTDAQNELDLVGQVLLLLYKQANMTFNFRINVYTLS